jgi:hypothetical protein
MWKHVILYRSDDAFRVDGASDPKVRLEAREICICRKYPDKLIEKCLPLVEEQREELSL